MKKLIAICLAVLFSGIIASCKKEQVVPETATLHNFATNDRRDLGNAD